tara:strand:+ start:249 stop:422 length:174 start_codon:yes stop_codon:yes gene_type:complete
MSTRQDEESFSSSTSDEASELMAVVVGSLKVRAVAVMSEFEESADASTEDCVDAMAA